MNPLLVLLLAMPPTAGAVQSASNTTQAQPQHVYRSAAQRSPFAPASAVEPAVAQTGAKPDAARGKEPLEFFSLEQLRLVGTLAGRGTTHALIRDPSGAVHRLAAGDHLGAGHGRVEIVREGAVELVEMVADGAGGWIRRRRTLVLAAAEAAAGNAEARPQAGSQQDD